MSGSNYDPFDVSHTDQPYSGNMLNPDFARNLMAFGASMMTASNQRTPSGHLAFGTGVFGPVGAGIQGAMQQNLEAGKTRSSIGYQNAQTQGAQLDNQLKAMGLPYQQSLIELRSRLLSNPALMQQYMQQMGGGDGGLPGAATGQTAQGSDTPPPEGAYGRGGPGGSAAPPAEYMPFYKEASDRTGIPVDVLIAQHRQESGFNPNATGKAGEIGIGQVHPDTARNPGYGMAGVDPETLRDPRANINFSADYLKARGGAGNWTDQAHQRRALQAYNGGGDPNYVANVTRYLPAPTTGGSGQTQQQAAPAPTPAPEPTPAPYRVASIGAVPPPPNTAAQPPEPQAPPAPVPPAAQPQPVPRSQQTAQASPQAPTQTGPDPKAMATAQQYEQRASAIEFMRSLGVPAPGDPAGLRQAAQAWREFAFTGAKAAATQQAEVAAAGPKATAVAQAEFPTALAKLGYVLGQDGRMTAIAGGPADPARLGAVKAAEENAALPAKLAADGWMPNADGSGYVPIPGGKQDPRTIQQQTAAKSSGENVDIRQGGLARVMNADGSFSFIKNPQLEKVQLPDGTERYAHISPPPPGSPPGTQGDTTYVVDDKGKPVDAKITPMQEAFQRTRGTHLAEQQDKVDADAASAKESNYLFDNLRRDSQTWDMGKFADIEGEARAYLSAFAQAAGIETPGLNEKLADYQAFGKSSGMLLRTAVHDTSSRAAVQEYSMIGKTLPQPTTSRQGFNQIADQWQGLSDFRIAKQQFARGYQGNPQDFNTDFNTKVSPTSFMLNRMEQTAEGHQDAQAMLARMQATPEGKLLARRMLQQYQYAKTNGMFDSMPTEQAP